MEQLKIYTADGFLLLPKTRDLEVGGEVVSKEVTMAGGRRVMYVQGYREEIKAKWDWFPADQLAELTKLLRQGGFFKVAYPDQRGNECEGYFSITYPATEVFKFKDGKPMWHGVSLTLKAQEVS